MEKLPPALESIIGGIKECGLIYHKNATSGGAYKIVGCDGDIYKLTKYEDASKAALVEQRVALAPEIVNLPIASQDKFLLFKWIEGEVLVAPVSDEDAHLLGEIYGKVHALELHNEITVEERVDRYLFKLKETVPSDQFEIARTILKEKASAFVDEYQILEITDGNLANFLRTKDGLVIIDADAITFNIRGRGIIGVLGNLSPPQEQIFWRAYEKYHEANWFTPAYRDALEFLALTLRRAHTANKYGSYRLGTWQHDKYESAKEAFEKRLAEIEKTKGD